MKQLFFKIGKIIWYTCAAIIILVSISITVAKALTPLLNHHRKDFITLISHHLGVPVQIAQVRVWWHGFEPEVAFDQVNLLSNDSNTPLLHIKKIEITLKIIASIINRAPEPSSIILSGINTTLQQQPDNSFTLPIFTKSITATAVDTNKIYPIVFGLPRFILHQARINAVFNNGKTANIQIRYLELLNKPSLHRLTAGFNIKGQHANQILISVLVHGHPKQLSSINANAYAKITDLSLADLPYSLQGAGYQVTNSLLDAGIWLVIKNGQWLLLQSHAKLTNTLLISQQNSQQIVNIQQLSGNFALQKQKSGWQLMADQMQLIINHSRWPVDKFLLKNFQANNSSTQTLWINYLKIQDIIPLLTGSHLLPTNWQNIVNNLQPAGILQNLTLAHEGSLQEIGQWNLRTEFNHFVNSAWGKIPGVSNLSGIIVINPQQSYVDLNTHYLLLNYPLLFDHSLPIDLLTGQLEWQKNADNGSWQIIGKNIKAASYDSALKGEFALLLTPPYNKPLLSLTAGYYVNDAQQAQRYIPGGILKPELLRWLRQAIIRNDGGTGTLILRGYLSDFPFDKNQGIFISDTAINNMDLSFSAGWPILHNIAGELIFNNRNMFCQIEQGGILNASIQHASVTIPNMGSNNQLTLYANGTINSDTNQIIKFFQQSPLAKLLGNHLQFLQLEGKSQLNLNLTIPLTQPDNTLYSGNINLINNQLSAPAWGLSLQNINGNINFANDYAASQLIQANFLGVPATINILTNKDTAHSPTVHVNLQSNTSTAILQNYLHIVIPSFISGQFNYTADVALHLATNDSLQNSVTLSTNLQGVSVNLPSPFNKNFNTILASNFTLFFGGKDSEHAVATYGNLASAAFLFKTTNNLTTLFSTNLHLGGTNAVVQQEPGLFIDGYLSNFDWENWQPYLPTISINSTQKLTQPSTNTKQPLRKINIAIGSLSAWQQNWPLVQLQITPLNNNWLIQINSPQLAGSLNYTNNEVDGEFSKLSLATVKSNNNSPAIKPQLIPALNLNITNFYYDNNNLGNISLQTTPIANGMLIKQLNLSSPLLAANLSGTWDNINGAFHSYLQGSLNSSNIQSLLNAWQIKSSLLLTEGSLTFNLSWPDAPYKMQVNKITGSANFNFGKGFIVDLNQSTTAKLNLGRLLTLLSIDHLMLGFSDLTHKGYPFSQMTGNIYFQQGLISTQNLHFTGPVADLNFSGTVNHINQQINLYLTVVAHTTSSLPVIIGIVGTPIAGVATWVANKLIHNEVDKLTTYHYQIMGNFNHPQIKQILHDKLSISP